DLYGLGQPDPQRQGLEGAVLPHHGRASRHLPRPDGQHAVGGVRLWQGPALRALPDALRLRTFRSPGRQPSIRRQSQDVAVAIELTRERGRVSAPCYKAHGLQSTRGADATPLATPRYPT